MAAKFEIKKGNNGKFHFSLKSGNGQIVLTSQMYETKKSAENGIKSVKTNSQEKSRFDRRSAKNGKPYFVLKSGNGQEIGKSQMYSSESSMEKGIQSVVTNAPVAEIVDSTAV